MNKRRFNVRQKYFVAGGAQAASRRTGLAGPIVLVFLVVAVVVSGIYVIAFRDSAVSPGGLRRPFAPPRVKATLAQYSQVQNGMTEDQVLRIMGSPGEEIVSYEFGGQLAEASSKVLQWKNDEASVLVVSFGDGRVIAKSQAGLR